MKYTEVLEFSLLTSLSGMCIATVFTIGRRVVRTPVTQVGKSDSFMGAGMCIGD